jgi:hypothetical protein
MTAKPLLALLAKASFATAIATSAVAGVTPATTPSEPLTADTWSRLNDWSIGGILFPSLHLHGTGGFSTGNPAELATGGHDPRREDISAQAIEPGLSLQTKYLEGFANYVFFQDAAGDWDGELEEAFGKLTNIPGGFELKGGQFLSRFGAANDKHLHAWDFIDAELVRSRFLGDDGLLLRGGEISWTLPLGTDPVFTSIVSLGYGETRPHEHSPAHGHDGEEHAEESTYDSEEAALADDVWTARLMGRYRFSDFHSLTGGFSYAGGNNGFGRRTDVAGVDLEFLWRENGLEPGGRAFRWRNEFLWRQVEASASDEQDAHEADHGDHAGDSEEADHDDHEEIASGTFNETGLYSSAVYTWNKHLDTGLRVGWVGGIGDFGQDERLRVSPNLTWWLDNDRRIALRTQYNYDSLGDSGDEHSVWFQVSIALGSTTEVR